MPRSIFDGLRNPFDNVGPYWADRNAEFEQTNPSFGERAWRAVNPITGFGSALGSMHSNISQGNFGQAALSAGSALPLLASLRPVKTLDGIVRVPALARTAAKVAGSAAGAEAQGLLPGPDIPVPDQSAAETQRLLSAPTPNEFPAETVRLRNAGTPNEFPAETARLQRAGIPNEFPAETERLLRSGGNYAR